jgi:hypothetical protein
MMGNPVSGKLSILLSCSYQRPCVHVVVAFIDKILYGVNTVLGKECVGGGGLDKQYKAIKPSPTISSILHSGPYGIYYIRKPLNK